MDFSLRNTVNQIIHRFNHQHTLRSKKLFITLKFSPLLNKNKIKTSPF